ncbi:MAG: prolipoprotein diacylglyceryl transferase [Bacilli bacterium]|nr:prolipoprotein diacylglyceryl transferase [Bacilli bacterium]
MNSNLLELGPITIKWYSFFILLGILLGSFLIIKEWKKKNGKEEDITNILFYGILIGIVGARLHYCLFNLDYYKDDLLGIFQVWNGGLAIHGGILFGLIFMIIYCKKKKINLFLLLDIITPSLLLAQALGRWGNFFNQEAFGRIVSLKFLKNLHLPNFIIERMYIDGYYREPTFLYESVISLIGFFLLIVLRKQKKIKTGILCSTYLIWYGIERLIIETFRSDSLMLGPLKVAQIISILFIIGGITLIMKSYKKNNYYIEDKIKTRRMKYE